MKSLQASVSNERGFQRKGPRQPHKHAKRNAAIEQLEERGKHCWHVAYHRVGEIWQAQKKIILMLLQEELYDLSDLIHI